jgi:glycine/D-amino acid oxidase-like deaminating enzyme/nitrite reductase/ring-hydroxylating ferredoxin subunit
MQEQEIPIWSQGTDIPKAEPIEANLQTDVCVIGAGIAGLTTAYLLSRQGLKVTVLEAKELISGETFNTTAHLSNAIDDRYTEIERIHGLEKTRLVAESHTFAINFIENTARAEEIECDFKRLDGYLFVPPGEDTAILMEELQAAHRAGLTKVELLQQSPLESFNIAPCLRFPEQGRFHPLKYLSGLVERIRQNGGKIYTGTRVKNVDGGSRAVVETENGVLVGAGAVVVATNNPVNDRLVTQVKQAPYRTYVIGAPVPKGSVKDALYWDTSDPYHYVRLQEMENDSANQLLIVGGEDHKSGQANDGEARYRKLEEWARRHFPMMGEVVHRWSGQVMETVDGLAFIGHVPFQSNVYYATGDSGMGMTHGTIAGILLTDLITGKSSRWSEVYSVGRLRSGSLGELVNENLNVLSRFSEWFTEPDVDSISQIPRGEGAIIREGLAKVAVYKDEEGKVTRLSAVCPHLACIVAWNSTERSWDCPCHGSRFDSYGKLVNGPASRDLKPG